MQISNLVLKVKIGKSQTKQIQDKNNNNNKKRKKTKQQTNKKNPEKDPFKIAKIGQGH